MKLRTMAVHAGRRVDPTTGAVTHPLHLSTTYERDPDGGFARGFCYTREGNPTRIALETALASLEGGAECITFPSGMAAISALLLAQPQGARVIVGHDLYFGVRKLVSEQSLAGRLETIFVDMTDLAALETACGPGAALLLTETPSNPLLNVVDLEAVAAIARKAGARSACDNTAASPVFQQPLSHGFDYSVHSLTKFVAGHHDAMAGAVICRETDGEYPALRRLQDLHGFVPSPFDAWIALRGLQTLPVRMAAHERGTMEVARFLEAEPGVGRVHYPGLESHPGHAIARRQMTGFGALLSIELADKESAFEVANALRIFTRATSLGGTHSLVEHRHSVEGPGSLAPPGLLRLSIGLEDPEDLIADLAQALNAAG